MVKITDYKEAKKKNGEVFYTLELQGGIELVQSESTGKFYATMKKTTIPSTFDEQTCMAIIGTEMPGNILKEECEPYSFINKDTGEEITMSYRWVYSPNETVKENTNDTLTNQIIPEVNQFNNRTMGYA